MGASQLTPEQIKALAKKLIEDFSFTAPELLEWKIQERLGIRLLGSDASRWGYFGNRPPCAHLVALRAFLEASEMAVYSEHGEDPKGWVNVVCSQCARTYETTLCEPWEAGDE